MKFIKPKIQILLCLSIILFLNVSNGYSSAYPSNTNPSKIRTDQIEGVHFPVILVTKILVNTQEPEEGHPIDITVTIKNEDIITFNQLLTLHLAFDLESRDLHSTEESESELIINRTLSTIEDGDTLDVPVTFEIKGGEYSINAHLKYNGTTIPTSAYTTTIQVMGPPLGDIPRLIISVIIIIFVILAVMLIPSVTDKFRKFKHSNGDNNNEKI